MVFGCVTSKAETNEQLITIEFNPNKCLPGSTSLVYLLNRLNNRLKIRRFDLAIDIPFNILNLNFENLTKRSSTVLYEYQDNRTIYFGKGNGHTKIYNKKIESNLDFELTRYEITREIDCPVSMINGFPDITFNFLSCNLMPYNEHTDNKTHNAIAYALNNGYHFKDLSRDMQKNIIKNAKFNFELSEQVANNVLRATINSIFSFA